MGTRYVGPLTLISAMASSVVVKVYRDDDQGSAFERHRDRVPFDTDNNNTMEKACTHLIDFMGIKEQVEKSEKFGLGAVKLFRLSRLEKIEGKAENCAIVTKAQLEMELPVLLRSATSELNGMYFVSSFSLESCREASAG